MKKKWYIVKNEKGEVSATNVMAQGETLLPVGELNKHEWLFEKFPDSIFIVKE